MTWLLVCVMSEAGLLVSSLNFLKCLYSVLHHTTVLELRRSCTTYACPIIDYNSGAACVGMISGRVGQ